LNKFSIEEAWRKLFEKYDIVEYVHKNGEFKISSNQINELKEARLMAKFDQSAQLPGYISRKWTIYSSYFSWRVFNKYF
jgi:hypothetical protein